jgi:AraC family transcriptional regulator
MTKNSFLQLKPPVLEIRKQFFVAGLKERYSPATIGNIPALWQRLLPHFKNIPDQVGYAAYGLVWNLNEGFDYMAGAEVSKIAVSSDLIQVSIPTLKYAMFSHRGHVSELKTFMMLIGQQWLPSWGQALANGSGEVPNAIEYYGKDFDPKTGSGTTEIWIPVKE